MRHLPLRLALAIVVSLPSAAAAQRTVTLTPELSIAAVADSNVLSTLQTPQFDTVQRVTPSLRLDLRSRLWVIDTGYTMDAERYDRFPSLNRLAARQQADIHLDRTGRTVNFAMDALYLTTNAPLEINVQAGAPLNVQRGPATNLSLAPSTLAWLSPRTQVTAGASFGRTTYQTTIPAGTVDASILTWGGTAGIGRRLTTADVARLEYQGRRFDFRERDAGSTAGSSGFHALLAGWTHGEALATSITVSAGPRFSNGSVRPELSAAFRHRIRSGEFSLTAASTEQAAVGEAGSVEVQRVMANVTARPARRLELRFEPGIGHQAARVSGLRADTYLFNTAATTAVAGWLAVELSFRGVWQRGELPLVGPLNYDRRIVLLRAIVPGLRLRDMSGPPTPQR